MSRDALFAAVGGMVGHRARYEPCAALARVSVDACLRVHLALANRYDERRGFVDSTVGQLAEQTGASTHVVKRALSALDASGLWVAAEHGNQRHGTRRTPGFDMPSYPQGSSHPRAPSTSEPVALGGTSEAGSSHLTRTEPNGDAPLVALGEPSTMPHAHVLVAFEQGARRILDTRSSHLVRPSTSLQNELPPAHVRDDVDRARPESVGGLDQSKWKLDDVMRSAVDQLVAYRAVNIGAPRDPAKTRSIAERDCEQHRAQAQAWLDEGRRPYDIARSVCARANGEASSRPQTRSELGLDP